MYKASDGNGKSITTEGMEIEEAFEFFFKPFFLRAMQILYTDVENEELSLSDFNQNEGDFYLQDMDRAFSFTISKVKEHL